MKRLKSSMFDNHAIAQSLFSFISNDFVPLRVVSEGFKIINW